MRKGEIMNSILSKNNSLKFRAVILIVATSLFFSGSCFLVADETLADEAKEGVLGLLFREEKQLMKDASQAAGDAEIKRQMANLRANISEELVQHHRYSMAMDYLHNSLSLEPLHADRWERLGDLCHFIGHPSSAYKAQYAYERALLIEPARQSARYKLAGAFLRSERFIKSMEQYEILIERDKGALGWEPFGLLASIYATLDEIPRGAAFFKKCLKRHDDDKLRIALAVLLHTSGDTHSAVRLLESIVAKDGGKSPLSMYAASLKNKYAGK